MYLQNRYLVSSVMHDLAQNVLAGDERAAFSLLASAVRSGSMDVVEHVLSVIQQEFSENAVRQRRTFASFTRNRCLAGHSLPNEGRMHGYAVRSRWILPDYSSAFNHRSLHDSVAGCHDEKSEARSYQFYPDVIQLIQYCNNFRNV